jgi:hypothetical protein
VRSAASSSAARRVVAAVSRYDRLFLVTTLAKVIRDQQEAATIRVRLDEARMEKLIAEHNPSTPVS